jgi:hypothetical protein
VLTEEAVKITAGQIEATPVATPSAPANPVKNERAPTATLSASTLEKSAKAASTLSTDSADPSTDVTVRRDNNGRVYYVVSDANSGQEILEVPPKALRAVGQGIEDYVKEIQARATSHVRVKA